MSRPVRADFRAPSNTVRLTQRATTLHTVSPQYAKQWKSQDFRYEIINSEHQV